MPSSQNSRGRHVFFVTTEFGRGGAETQILRVGMALRLRGWRVSVLSLVAPEGFVEEARAAGIELHSLDMARGQVSAGALRRAIALVREARPSVLAAFLFHAVALGALIGKATGIPICIASIRDSEFGGPRNLTILRWLVRLRLFDSVVTNSDLVARALSSTGVIDAESLSVIHNGIDIVPRVSDARRRTIRREIFGAVDQDFQWIAVGNFRPNKDYPNIARAFSIVAARDSRARLALVGRGDPPAEISSCLADPALGPRIALLGQRQDVRELLGAADALVLGSVIEGLPNVVIESLSVATPVVATNVDGVPEVVRDGETGLLVAPRDHDALAAAMLAMAGMMDADRRAMASAGQRDVLQRYDLGAVTDEWEKLFLR